MQEARVALASFANRHGYSIQKDGWMTDLQLHVVSSRAKRALGVAMYVYRGPKVILESVVNLR